MERRLTSSAPGAGRVAFGLHASHAGFNAGSGRSEWPDYALRAFVRLELEVSAWQM